MNWTSLFVAVLGLLRDGFPFPANWASQSDVQGWLHRSEPHLAKLIALVAAEFQESGATLAMLPGEDIKATLKARLLDEAKLQGVEIDMETILKVVEFILWLIGLFGVGGTPGAAEE